VLALLSLLLGLACFTRSMGPARTIPAVWLAPGLERIGRDDLAGTGLTLELSAARGEHESFQVAIQAPAAGLTSVTARVGALRGPSGAAIGDANIALYREHYVYVADPSPDERGTNRPLGVGWYADALIPVGAGGRATQPFAVAPHQNQPIWVDIFVPRDAAAGQYRAEVVVSSDQGRVVAQLRLYVWDFALPLAPTLNSAFLIWDADSAQAQAELLKHRLMPRDVDVRDQARLAESWGLKSINLGLWSEATIKQCAMSPAPSVQEVREVAAPHLPSLRRYNYTADEIDRCPGAYETMKAWARALHAAGVDNLVTMTPVPELYDDGTGSGRSAVDIWVLLPKMFDSAPERVAAVQQKGDEVWSYNALVQDGYSPKWEIDFAPINYRIQPGFLSQSLGLSGLLYWRVDLWTGDPWNDVHTYRKDGSSYPGEGMLLYPGEPIGVAGVVPSLRLKWLRDGVDDYEYIELLKRQGCEQLGSAISRRLAASWSQWTKDPISLEQQRLRLGAYVEYAEQHGSCPRA
jgi:hypothetical protein